MKLIAAVLGVATTLALPSLAHAAMTCEALKGVHIPHVTITAADATTPPFQPPGGGGLMGPPVVTTPFCRVQGVSRPTSDSEIGFELWIPAGDAWNGRYLQVGNGGFAGTIPYSSLNLGLKGGYATAGTDDGHKSPVGTDAAWALGHPEKVVDYGYRALKETTDASKAILAAYAGAPPKFSYFNGCSDGGREALMEATRYPADFDGIVAGDPASNWIPLIVTAGYDFQALNATPDSFIAPAKLKAIQAATGAACADAEGVIENPATCKFDPAVLLCTGAETDQCLTQHQVEALNRIYGGSHGPDGKQILPGFVPGAEAAFLGWRTWITGGAPGPAGHSAQYEFGRNFFQYVVKNDPTFDLMTLNFDSDYRDADRRFTAIIGSANPDLSAFKRRGGKLIQYHGWADPAIPAKDSIRYFDSVQARMGETGDFYRLFMAPGMLHCAGGPGANTFDTQAAISAWVEHGQPPARLVAAKYAGDNPAGAVQFTRPLCPHPQVATWDGKGDRAKAESWVCKGA